MDASEKSITRARLIASGIIRYWHYEKSKEVHQWLEIMAEKLASLKEQDAVMKIREDLQRYGLRVPELNAPVHTDRGVETTKPSEMNADSGVTEMCSRMTKDNTQGLPVHPDVALDPQEAPQTGAS